MSFEQNHHGIPTPNELEFTLLAADTLESGLVNPHELGANIIHKNPNLKKVLSKDIFHWIENIAKQMDMEQDEILEFAEGIDTGFSFFIGTITNIRFLRSGFKNVYEFIDATSTSGDTIPLVGERELQRVESVRLGAAIIDPIVAKGFVADSSDLASSHTTDYIINSKAFSELLEIEFNGIELALVDKIPRRFYDDEGLRYREIERLSVARISGFEHGVETAVEMYQQVAQEQIIAKLESL